MKKQLKKQVSFEKDVDGKKKIEKQEDKVHETEPTPTVVKQDDVEAEEAKELEMLKRASDMIREGGGASSTMSIGKNNRKSMRLTVAELEKSLENMTQSVLNFDVQSWIQERINEVSAPLMHSMKKFLGEMKDLDKEFKEYRRDQKETNIMLTTSLA